jgi:hypothetical protein
MEPVAIVDHSMVFMEPVAIVDHSMAVCSSWTLPEEMGR